MYSVQQGQCFVVPNLPVDDQLFDPPDSETVDQTDLSEVTRMGTDTIDGQQVIVYDVSGTEFGQSGGARYYLRADSGRLRRIEAGSQQMDFFAWDEEVASIQPPEMDCTAPGGR